MAKSMQLNAAAGLSSMLKEGYKHFEGVDEATAKNIDAVKQLADITRTSLGPNGMNKLVINHLDRIFVTSDTATIVRELEVIHPAAKMVVMAAKMQENEFGDGTNVVVSLAGELLIQAASLLRMGLHASEIIIGYKKATKKVLELINQLVIYKATNLRDKTELKYIIKPVILSKQYGYEDILSDLIADACLLSFPPVPKKLTLNVDNIRVVKIMGGNIYDSKVIKGIVISRDTEGSIKQMKNCKIAVFSCGIESSSTEAKSTVLINNAKELLNYSKSEEKKIEEIIVSIKEQGVNVVISGGSISEMALHFLEKYQIMVIKITSKWELRRLCKSVRALAMVRLGPPTIDEIGNCESIKVREIGNKKIIVFEHEQDSDNSYISTIILRSSTENVLNDLERAIDDGVNCVKSSCGCNYSEDNDQSGCFVAGGGACEVELARQLRAYGDHVVTLEQYAIKKYADSLDVITRTLAENTGKKATKILSLIYAEHAKGNKNIGVDMEGESETGIKDNVTNGGIIDHLLTKKSAIRLGSDAAITILRVDQIIMAKAAGGPKPQGP